MFYEVRIKNPDGSLKKVVTQRTLLKLHWENFQKAEDGIGLVTASRPQVPAWVKQNLDAIYPEASDNY